MIADQLVGIYKKEPWHRQRMSDDHAYDYYEKMLDDGRIILFLRDEKILGYVEFTRINFTQLGYLMVSKSIHPEICDPKGWVLYVTSLYVEPEFRHLGITRKLRKELIERNPNSKFLVGETQGRNRKSWAVYRINSKGVPNGKR